MLELLCVGVFILFCVSTVWFIAALDRMLEAES